jgi:hypothetical protein
MTNDQRRFFRDEFRSARASALRDAENFDELLILLERLGLFLSKRQGSLNVAAVAGALAERPMLVINQDGRLLGILTAFDLL